MINEDKLLTKIEHKDNDVNNLHPNYENFMNFRTPFLATAGFIKIFDTNFMHSALQVNAEDRTLSFLSAQLLITDISGDGQAQGKFIVDINFRPNFSVLGEVNAQLVCRPLYMTNGPTINAYLLYTKISDMPLLYSTQIYLRSISPGARLRTSFIDFYTNISPESLDYVTPYKVDGSLSYSVKSRLQNFFGNNIENAVIIDGLPTDYTIIDGYQMNNHEMVYTAGTSFTINQNTEVIIIQPASAQTLSTIILDGNEFTSLIHVRRKIIVLRFTNNITTIVSTLSINNGNMFEIFLNGGLNVTPNTGNSLTLEFNGNKWQEISRSFSY